MPILTTREAAAYLKLHPDTLRRKLSHKEVPATKLGGHWRFRTEVLDEWLAQGCPSQAEQPSLFDR
jgi:excisionase family DNA binding protein